MTLLGSAADLLLGGACLGCGAVAASLCAACRTELTAQSPRRVGRAGLDVPVVAANPYRPLVSRLVPRYKDDGAWQLGPVLAARLWSAVWMLRPPVGTLLVPVPSRPSAVRRRGLDHGRGLASEAARRGRMRMIPLLSRAPDGERQRGLTRAGRAQNAGHSMMARRTRAPVVVCDDVITTGASLVEAVRALRSSGVEVLGAAVVGDADRMVPARV